MKKSQVTVFIIVGILLVALIGFFLFRMNSTKSQDLQANRITTQAFSQDAKLLESYRDECIQKAIENALIYRSFEPTPEDEEELERY